MKLAWEGLKLAGTFILLGYVLFDLWRVWIGWVCS